MLQHLYIRNYILIEELSIDFMPGFSVITGETGAGKSILLGALNLLLGERISGKLLKDNSKKAIFEAEFNINGYNLKPLFEKLDLDYESQTIIRREILPSGKSRAFINDTPVSLTDLRKITERLIDIHSQHENLLLNNPAFRYSVLDTIAGTTTLLEDYQTTLSRYKSLKKELSFLKEKALVSQKERDFLQYQFDQLEEADLQENEYQEIETKIETLSHYEDIKQAFSQIVYALNEQEDDIPAQINRLIDSLTPVTRFMEDAKQWQDRLQQVSVELQDIADEVFHKNELLEYNPAELESLRNRLDLLNSLMQKLSVSSYENLLAEKTVIDKKLQEIDSFDDRIENTSKALTKEEKKLHQLADELSKKRLSAAPVLAQNILDIIKHLGMPKAQFEIQVIPQETFSAYGKDELIFLFSATKKTPEPVHKVASGGELSRIMLALKSILAEKQNLPSLIFDEIDTGISGETAAQMAAIMKKMGHHMQLIAITHLPQITAVGQHHYLVEKIDTDTESTTTMRQLSPDERIQEVAKMLSNGKITNAMLQTAKELLN
jgi:DNA repair protein RecN (Recombination protein N)